MRRLALFALLVLFLPSVFAHAQSTPEDIISSGIILSTDPQIPGPNTPTTVTLSSSSTDLDRSVITWKVDGKQAASGTGVKTITLTTGQNGESTTVSVTVDSPDGSFDKSLTITPASVDLFWQGDTYAPPFYEGRTLWTHQSSITLYAVPHVNAKSVAYRWSLDGDVVGSVSGVGRNSFTITDSLLGLPRTFTIDIMTDDQTVAASRSVTLTSGAPSLLVYENNPLTGYRFEHEVGHTYALSDAEVTLAAFPLFFDTAKRASGMTYAWSTNGTGSQAGPEVTYRAPASAGQSSVSLSASLSGKVLQTAEKDFLVQFGNTSNAF